MSNIKIYGEHEPKTLAQMQRCMTVGSAVKGVLCADGHLGYAHPIGGVVAYEEDISISGVGFDIACGNMAVRLDARYTDIAPRAKTILDDIGRSISFGVGQRNAVKVDHELFDSALWDAAGVANLKEMARHQLGTVGSGNHYVDLFEDEEGLVWIGVHFGSRGLGPQDHDQASGMGRCQGRHGGRSGRGPRRWRHRTELHRRDRTRRAVCLRRPRVGGGAGAPDHRRRRDRERAQPPQLRLARDARRS